LVVALGERVVVPFGAVDLDDEARLGPVEVGVDRAAGELGRSDKRVAEAGRLRWPTA
jgi:hypothetical protein